MGDAALTEPIAQARLLMTADGAKAAEVADLVPGETPALGSAASWPADERTLTAWTDHYFRRTAAAVRHFGDVSATYAVFLPPLITANLTALGLDTPLLYDAVELPRLVLSALGALVAAVRGGEPLKLAWQLVLALKVTDPSEQSESPLHPVKNDPE